MSRIVAALALVVTAGCASERIVTPTTNGSSSTDAGGCTPDYACQPTPPDTGDYRADCVARVNQFRACVCLPPLIRWNEGEFCADQDAVYDSTHTPHAGFIANICAPQGNAENECQGYQTSDAVSVCMQDMFNEGPPPTADCTGDCFLAHGHFLNMTDPAFTGVACGIETTNGVVSVQNFY
jgi:hypothetical protein